MRLVAFLVLAAWLLPSHSTWGGQADTTAPAQGLTVRAIRVTEPLRIDGRLDEAFYRTEPISNFVQVEPAEGEPATEKTDVWLAFDDDNLYVVFRNWESQPGRVVAKEMRRDHTTIWSGDDIVAFHLDTFHDRRNGFEFALNSIGGRQDAQTSNERQWNGDWNTVWSYSVGTFEQGWVVEAAIPFKSLRYAPGSEQTWGFNAFRTNRWKNELSFLSPTPKARGQGGLHMASRSANLVGLMVPSGSKNLEIKPYAISSVNSARTPAFSLDSDLRGDVGVDVKYGLTQSIAADFTYNTDFAQVEADQQQVNLTRFSLFFPEKREFFLENQGMFTFGQTQTNTTGDTPLLFYSRRIGLERGEAVPIDLGGRMTGRAGRYSFGALNIQTDDTASGVKPTNFSVVRLRRNVLRRSAVGLMFTARNEDGRATGDNAAYGVDGTFAFFANLNINTYWAQSDTRGPSSGNASYRGQLDYAGDRYGVQLERMSIGEAFNPGVGYVRRPDMRKTFALGRFSPRPRDSRLVRKYFWSGSVDHIENTDGRLETREREGEFAIEFQNADRFAVTYTNSYEFLPQPFRIAPGVVLPVGGYDFDNARVSFNRSVQQQVSGNAFVEYGTFYNGHKTAAGVASGRVSLHARVSVEPSYSLNRVSLVQGDFTTHLAGTRVTYTPTALMFVSAFVQYNSSTHAVSSNVRLRWEYRPGSELFVVYNEERDTLDHGMPQLSNRAFIVKVNRLFRF